MQRVGSSCVHENKTSFSNLPKISPRNVISMEDDNLLIENLCQVLGGFHDFENG